jgi:threonine aldolase
MKTYREAMASAAYRMRGHQPDSIRFLSEALAVLETDPLPDLYGKGPVIEDFQNRISKDLGKEQSVFFPSGTMAQQIALRIGCDEKQLQSVAYHPLCHLEIHEQDGLKELHHIETILLGDRDRLFTLNDLKNLDEVACVLFELPQREIGGQLPSWDDLVEMTSYCKSRGFHIHLDGARLLECLPFYGKTAAEVCAMFDSVYISFYKALGGITGAMLSGNATFMEKSKIWKRRHGGDLFHLYPYILSAQYVYDLRKDKMGEYWDYAKSICMQLNRIKGFRTVPEVPVCNMFHLYIEHPQERVEAALIKVMEIYDINLLSGLSIRGDQTFSEIWMGDSYPLVPKDRLNAALEMLSHELTDRGLEA